jgi:hypothetical protein
VSRLVSRCKKQVNNPLNNKWLKKDLSIIASAAQAAPDTAWDIPARCHDFCPLRTMGNETTIVLLKIAGKNPCHSNPVATVPLLAILNRSRLMSIPGTGVPGAVPPNIATNLYTTS